MALTDNLVGRWKFDESSGNAADSSGNGNTLTNNGTVPYVAGALGNAADFSGTSGQYFSRGSLTGSTLAGSITISARVKLGGSGNSQVIANLNAFDIELAITSLDAVIAYYKAGANQVSTVNGAITADGLYHNIIFRVTASAISISVDNDSYYAGATNGQSLSSANGTLQIGRSVFSDRYLRSDVCEIAIWDRELTAGEEATLYNDGAFLDDWSGGGGGPQTITCSGIASGEAFGTATLNQQIQGSGIGSAEAFGTAALHQQLQCNGIASGEAFGIVTLNQQIQGSGIGSGEAFGTATLQQRIQCNGIGSGETFGGATIGFSQPQTIICSGIASGEAFGLGTISNRKRSVKNQIMTRIVSNLMVLKSVANPVPMGRFRLIERSIDMLASDKARPALYIYDEPEETIAQDNRGRTFTFNVAMKILIDGSDIADKKDDYVAEVQRIIESDPQLGGLCDTIEGGEEQPYLQASENSQLGGALLQYRIQYRRVLGDPYFTY
ncbi:MAG: LamG-like jellyroll fold domain-containing protein [Verrucomicrobiota bacterium]|nr:LamG-like jellyroll fold domain-containing protein [Verrucomicrobiota bacterium]